MKKIDEKGNFSFLTKVSYGMGEMTFGVVNTILSVYLMITLTDYLKINPIWASVIVVLGILWDAVTDPVVGWISDNSGGKYGRRRSFMLFFAVPLGIVFFGLFAAAAYLPGAHEAVKIIVILLLYLNVFTMLTLVNVPYGSLIMEMTDDYDKRTGITGFRMALSAVSTIVAILIGDMLLGGTVASNGKKLIYVGLVFGVFSALATLICYLGTFERRKYVRMRPFPKFSAQKYLFKSWKSKPFRQVALAYLCAFTAIGLMQTLLQYYSTYWLKAPQLFVFLAGAVLIVAIIATPMWTAVSQKIGKKNTFLVSCAVSVASFAALFFLKQLETEAAGIALDDMFGAIGLMPWWSIAAIVILGVGIGGVQLMPFSMMPDAINISMEKGDMDEGAYYGVVTFVQKLGVGVATLLIGPILSLARYEAPPVGWVDEIDGIWPQPNHSAELAIQYMFILLSIAIIVLGALSVINYKVDKKTLEEKFKK